MITWSQPSDRRARPRKMGSAPRDRGGGGGGGGSAVGDSVRAKPRTPLSPIPRRFSSTIPTCSASFPPFRCGKLLHCAREAVCVRQRLASSVGWSFWSFETRGLQSQATDFDPGHVGAAANLLQTAPSAPFARNTMSAASQYPRHRKDSLQRRQDHRSRRSRHRAGRVTAPATKGRRSSRWQQR